MMFRKTLYAIATIAIMPLAQSHATEFEQCPTQAFLIQSPSGSAIIYGVDLASGDYDTLEPGMSISKLNGVGFNFHDNYLYGWDYDAQTLAKIGSDYVSQPLNIVSGLIGQPFFVGDVALNENAWYGYRPSVGLFRVDLTDPAAQLSMTQVATASSMGNPKLTDFAFHPTNGLLYAVDNDGFLMEIDVNDGGTTVLGEVLNETNAGFNFTFGAQYFDVDEHLYVSNNSNGYLYKIDLKSQTPTAEFFAYGPNSQSNDGARCALAPVEVTVGMDFGDAPDSYSTSFATSGPRHLESALFLGSQIDTEVDANLYPLSDDAASNIDDEDGVEFVTNMEVGEAALVRVTASEANGVLNAWIDFDGNGAFDEDEQVFTDKALNKGTSTLSYTVPNWAEAGTTWSRFRISSIEGLGPTGGVSDGEVEDYPVAITQQNVSVTYYPSANDYTSLAYEDLWPVKGDLDMNDLLMHMRITEFRKNDQIIKLEVTGKVAAVGAGYHNGFALQLPDVAPTTVDESRLQIEINQQTASHAVLETDQTNAVFIVMPDVKAHVDINQGCKFFRTEANCANSQLPTWKLTIPFIDGVAQNSFPAAPYDPFIFATEGMHHGSRVGNVTGGDPGRLWEVHLKNQAPTDSLHSRLLGRDDDRSDPLLGLFYQDNEGLPWALEIPATWQHPLEKVDIRQAYPMFAEFATSEGAVNTDWYQPNNANVELLYKEEN